MHVFFKGVLLGSAALVLVGCSHAPAGSLPKNAVEGKDYISCVEGGIANVYFIAKAGESLPSNASVPIELAKVAQDVRCFPGSEFSNVSQPDQCGSPHYHHDKTATDGTPLPDQQPHECGVATADQVKKYMVYELLGSPRDAPPPTIYGEEIDPNDNFCGPDITQGLLDALKRIYTRMQGYQGSQTGPVDGTLFLDKHGGSIDYRVSKQRNANDEAICPTKACMASDGQGTVSLCGQCIMEHNANDIMFGFTAAQLGVPYTVQILGAHYAEVSSYGSLDPTASQASYSMGNFVSVAMDDAGGNLTIGDFCDKLLESFIIPGGPIDFDAGTKSFEELGEEQAFLASCKPPPRACKASVIKDWSKSTWSLNK